MAIGTPVALDSETDAILGQTAIISIDAVWQVAIAAGGVATADNAGNSVTNPTQVTNATSHWLTTFRCKGTFLAFRLRYVGAVATSPVIEVLGRKGDTGAPQRLYNQATPQVTGITLTAAPTTDLTDGTYKWSEVAKDHIVDRMGCDQFLVTVKTAVAGGTTASDVVEVCPF